LLEISKLFMDKCTNKKKIVIVFEVHYNLVVELQVFKADNEKLKKAQQEQQEINEVLLHSIVTNKIPKDDNHDEEVSKRASKNFGAKTEKGDSSSEGTPSAEDKTIPDKKRNKPTTLKENLKILNQLLLMENPGQEKKPRHGCWTSKNTSKYTTIPVT
jgi:hypothetical protein